MSLLNLGITWEGKLLEYDSGYILEMNTGISVNRIIKRIAWWIFHETNSKLEGLERTNCCEVAYKTTRFQIESWLFHQPQSRWNKRRSWRLDDHWQYKWQKIRECQIKVNCRRCLHSKTSTSTNIEITSFIWICSSRSKFSSIIQSKIMEEISRLVLTIVSD